MEIKQDWEDAVNSLHSNARYGSTGTKLIYVGEKTFKKYVDHISSLNSRLKEERDKHSEEIKKLEDKSIEEIERRERIIDLQGETIEDLEKEIEGIKTLKVNPHVEDSDAKFVFKPRAQSPDYRYSYFTIEHMEEILMYLRMNGADDETPVSTSEKGIESVVTGIGYVMPSPSKSTKSLENDTSPKRSIIKRLTTNTVLRGTGVVLVGGGILTAIFNWIGLI